MPLMMTMINFIRARLWQDKAIRTQGFKLDNDDKLFENKKNTWIKKHPFNFFIMINDQNKGVTENCIFLYEKNAKK